MVKVSCNLTIECNGNTTWKFIENVKNTPKWAQGVISVDHVKPKNGQVCGTTFKQVIKEANKKITYQGEIVEYEKMKILKTIIRNDGIDIVNIFEIKSSNENETEIIYTVDIPSKTWIQWIFAPISLLFSKYTIISQGQALKEGIMRYKESQSTNKK